MTKSFKSDLLGASREVPSKLTLSKLLPKLDDYGITRLANITNLDRLGIPVWIAVRPQSRGLSLSQGKGISNTAAKVSALMETIETYYAERIEGPLLFGTQNDFKDRYSLIDVEKIPAPRNQTFTDNTPILWLETDCLVSGDKVLTPYKTVHINARIEQHGCYKYFFGGTNGLASGNTRQEAINHAICELVERDAYKLWSLSGGEKQLGSKIDLQTIEEPFLKELIDRFPEAGTSLGVWDMTSDIGVPTFLARVISNENYTQCKVRPASGMGTHPDKRIALSRAITEAAQSRLTFIAGARDDINLSHYRTHTADDEYSKWYQSIVNDPVSLSFSNIESFESNSVQESYQVLLDRLESVGLKQVLAYEMAEEEKDISVMKIIIPGLEGHESPQEAKLGERAKNVLMKIYEEQKAIRKVSNA